MYNNGYDFYELNQMSEEPKRRKKKSSTGNFMKRAGVLVLSGILLGGSAGVAFQSINYAFGQEESAGTSQTSTKTTSALRTAAVTSDGTTSSQSLDVSDIASGAMPSVVAITNKSVQEVESYYSMFGMSGYGQTQEVESAGSGIIIGENDTELLIVSNNHVVEGADTLSACFIDGTAYEASIKGTDADRDLAVIAVPLDSIPEETMEQIQVIQIGDSDSLKVGEQVVAIGNALGYGQSVTTGIVSALNRTIDDTDATFIQTDAAINPGNSGGALLNMQGELIGINSAKLASTEVEGMGYAIPLTEVESILEGLMNRTTREKVSDDAKASLGISGQNVSEEVSEMYGLPIGVYVSEVTEGSAAANAGISSGYIITEFDGTSVDTITELKELLEYYAAGETVEVVACVSNGGEYVEHTFTVTLGTSQSQTQTVEQGQMQQMPQMDGMQR